jgi:F-type H+-transporting ATPase subunit b
MERERLAAEVEKERATLEAQIEAMVAKAESNIAESKSKALGRVDSIATELAGIIVTRLIGNEIATDKVKQALKRQAAG